MYLYMCGSDKVLCLRCPVSTTSRFTVVAYFPSPLLTLDLLIFLFFVNFKSTERYLKIFGFVFLYE